MFQCQNEIERKGLEPPVKVQQQLLGYWYFVVARFEPSRCYLAAIEYLAAISMHLAILPCLHLGILEKAANDCRSIRSKRFAIGRTAVKTTPTTANNGQQVPPLLPRAKPDPSAEMAEGTRPPLSSDRKAKRKGPIGRDRGRSLNGSVLMPPTENNRPIGHGLERILVKGQ